MNSSPTVFSDSMTSINIGASAKFSVKTIHPSIKGDSGWQESFPFQNSIQVAKGRKSEIIILLMQHSVITSVDGKMTAHGKYVSEQMKMSSDRMVARPL